jgi:hypothetical protein
MPQTIQSQGNVMTAASQTMAGWSKVIESPEDIPAVYKSLFDRYFDSKHRFPTVIWIPALDTFPRRTTEKLICDNESALTIFEKIGNQVNVLCYPYHDIEETELGIVLLDSWITVSGKTKDGKSCVSTIHFNTTSKRYFESILNSLRPFPRMMDGALDAAEKDKFNDLSETNFKMMNYGRESLLPGESVLRILLQQEIRRPFLTVFGRTFSRTISPAHLTVITDRELILIRNTGSSRDGRAARYGGIWQYVPLRSVESVSLSETSNERLTLSIRLRSGRTIESIFEISNLPELEQFRSQLQWLIETVHAAG